MGGRDDIILWFKSGQRGVEAREGTEESPSLTKEEIIEMEMSVKAECIGLDKQDLGLYININKSVNSSLVFTVVKC